MTVEDLEAKLNVIELEIQNKYGIIATNDQMAYDRILADATGECILDYVNELADGLNYNKIKLDAGYIDFNDYEKSIIDDIKKCQSEFKVSVRDAIDHELKSDSYLMEDFGMDWLCEIIAVSYYAIREKSLYPELALEAAKAIYDYKTGRYDKLFRKGDRAVLDLYCTCLQNELGRMAREIVEFAKNI
ncbi:MAG: hypothetical protein MJ050_08615 [Phascolarctobacterium sp.]|nr:hypothetical protein [Phascolarctobacterium sp.]